MIFQKRKPRVQPVFKMNGENIDLEDEFRYLGVIFNYNGSFTKCRKVLSESATRALFFVLKKSQEFSLDVGVCMQLFDSMVKPILTFSSEIWGFENLKIIERVQLMFCKYILKLNRTTPNIMVYGELGCYPLEIDIKVKMIKFWGKLVLSENSTLSGKMYNMLYNMRMHRGITTKWLDSIKSTLEECGMGGIWITQQFRNIDHLGHSVKQRLRDQFIQGWRRDMRDSAKTLTYKNIKADLDLKAISIFYRGACA